MEKTIIPTVGMGATINFMSDSQAATITEVLSPTHIVIQSDKAVRTDKNGLSEQQEWEFTPNPKGEKFHVRKGKYGWRISANQTYASMRVTVGVRHQYDDPNF